MGAPRGQNCCRAMVLSHTVGGLIGRGPLARGREEDSYREADSAKAHVHSFWERIPSPEAPKAFEQVASPWLIGAGLDSSKASCEQHLAVLRCDDFIEQREHSRVSPHVVDANQCGGAVLWTQGFERKVVCSI